MDHLRDKLTNWPLSPGDLLSKGRLLLLDKLVETPVTEVWSAMDRRREETVAVKILSPDAARSHAQLLAFEKEAQALLQMDHPGIVRLRSLVERERDGKHFFSMELLSGQPIWFWSRPVARVLSDFAKILDVLAHIHARGMVHLALQPQNILLIEGQDREFPLKVLDFGSAHDGETLAVRLRMRSGVELGSSPEVGYLSPEQASGDHGSAGPASDLYAVGAMLYEALTGRRPFEGATWPVLLAHIGTTPSPPSLPQLDAETKQTLESLVMALLEKDYDKRPQSAAAVGRTLESLASRIPMDGAVTPIPNSSNVPTVSEMTVIQLPAMVDDYNVATMRMPALGSEADDTAPAWLRATAPSKAPSLEVPWQMRYARCVAPIGREEAQRSLVQALAEASRGAASCVLLRGARGAGKRNLARWFKTKCIEESMASVLTLDLNAETDFGSSFRQALDNALRRPLARRENLGDRVTDSLHLPPGEGREALVDFLLAPPTVGDTPPEGFASIWREALRGLAPPPDSGPLLVWLDGGDERVWTQASAWLESLIETARQDGLGLLAIWSPRHGCFSQDQAQRMLERRGFEELHLPPLSGGASRELISALEPDLAEECLEAISGRCDGNRRQMVETLSGFRERRILFKQTQSLRFDLDSISVAASLDEALHLRLSDFIRRSGAPAGAEVGLKRLALVGPNFTANQVGWCFEEAGPKAALLLLQERWLVRRELGREPHLAFMDEGLRRFIIANSSGRGEVRGLISSCVEVCLRGALEAQIVSDWPVARRNLVGALSMIDRWAPSIDGALKLMVLDGLARTAFEQGNSAETRRWARELSVQAKEAQVEGHTAEAAAWLWEGLASRLDGDACAREDLERAASAQGAPFFSALALMGLTDGDAARGNAQRAFDMLKGAAEEGESYRARLRRRALADATLGLSRCTDVQRNHGLHVRLLNRAIKLYQTERDLRAEVRATMELTRALRRRLEMGALPEEGAVDRLRRSWQRLQALESIVDGAAGKVAVVKEAAAIATLEGDIDRATSCHRAASGALRALGDIRGEALCHRDLGALALTCDDLQAGLEHFERYRQACAEVREAALEAEALTLLGWTQTHLGQEDLAMELLTRALALFGDTPGRTSASAAIGAAAISCRRGDLQTTVACLKRAKASTGGQSIDAPESVAALRDIKDGLRTSPSLLARAARKLAAGLLPPSQ